MPNFQTVLFYSLHVMGMKANVLQYVALSMTAAESLQKDKILQFTRCHQKFQINLFESKVYNSKENKIST